MSGNRPEGAISHLEERATNLRLLSEFREPALSFSVAETAMPLRGAWDQGIKTLVELRVGTSYTTFSGDREGAMYQRKSAYTSMANFLYADVLYDLREIVQAIGDGKRGESMRLVHELYDRLAK